MFSSRPKIHILSASDSLSDNRKIAVAQFIANVLNPLRIIKSCAPDGAEIVSLLHLHLLFTAVILGKDA